jgi:CubicO group peptidase (beta-lactamase class C family)
VVPVRGLIAVVVAVAAITAASCSADEQAGGSSAAPVTTQPATAATTPAAPATPASAVGESTSPATVVSPSVTPTSATPVNVSRSYDFSAVGPIVDAAIDEHDLNGAALLIVDRDGGVVHEQYWGEFGPDRVSLVASSSKMVTAGVLLHLQDQGLIDVDRPIVEVVAWGAGNPDVTVAQLLSNSSGLVGLLQDPGYRPYVCQFIATGALQACAEQIFTTGDDDGDVAAPDTEFRYGGGQWHVAGAVAEVVTGKPWSQLIDEVYAQPCGLTTLGYNNHFAQIGTSGFDYPERFDGDPNVLAATDNPNMEGGMYTAPGDYAQLLLMQLRGGRCGDNQVLSQAALDTMHADRIAAVYGGEARPDTGYGMGWFVERDTGRLIDPGAYGSVPWLDLDSGHGGFLVIEADTETGLEITEQLYDVVESAIVTARG